MRTNIKLFLILLFTSVLAAQCKTNTSSDKTDTNVTNIEDSKSLPATKFDTVSEQLMSKKSLITEDLVALKIVDTTLTMQLGESSYCDTTVQLNDRVYYSVITVGDAAGVCSYIFLASVEKKTRK